MRHPPGGWFPWAAAALVIVLWASWGHLILSHGQGYNFWEETLGVQDTFNFQSSGAFGDSFGSFSALMAALAAAGALSTLYLQTREQASRAFRDSFYHLLSQFLTIVNETREYILGPEILVDGTQTDREVLLHTVEGRAVFQVLVDEFRERIDYWRRPLEPELVCDIYQEFYAERSSILGHYYRVSYHLFKMVDEEAHSDPYSYARIVRAQLSNAELFLIAYTCICGEGRRRYVKYLKDYVLLNNMDFSRSSPFEEQFIRNALPPQCFRQEPEPPRWYRMWQIMRNDIKHFYRHLSFWAPKVSRRRTCIFDVVDDERVGLSYTADQVLSSVQPGAEVRLQAVSLEGSTGIFVKVDDEKIGWLTRADASSVSVAIMIDPDYRAQIYRIIGGTSNFPNYGCQISIAWGDDHLPAAPLDEAQVGFHKTRGEILSSKNRDELSVSIAEARRAAAQDQWEKGREGDESTKS